MRSSAGLKMDHSGGSAREGSGTGERTGDGVEERAEGSEERKSLAIYVHIPFCVKKCDYCDFLSAPASENTRENYVNLLCEEIEREAVRYPGYRVGTVFFGGGTPTVLKPEQLILILYKLKECFFISAGKSSSPKKHLIDLPETITEEKIRRTEAQDAKTQDKKTQGAEITLECNPGTVDGQDLKRLRKAGFDRLSIGLQSAQNEELKKLGRIHTWEDFLMTYRLAREAGFQNINVDLMSALPGQNVDSYINTLRRVTALRPEHISAYSLIIEEGTPFYERYGEADRQRRNDGEDEGHLLPSEEEERWMYELTQEILGQSGYLRYEISNYALPGYECRHNVTYWTRGNYLGLGLGAASLMDNCRFTKPQTMEEYERLLKEYEAEPEGEESPGSKKSPEYGASRADKSGLAVEMSQEYGVSRADKSGLADKKSPEYGVHLEDKKRLKSKDDRKGRGDFHRELQHLSHGEQMEEFMFLGLRLTEGVSRSTFRENFLTSMEEVYGNILRKLEAQGMLICSGDRVFLTKQGIDVSNVVLAEFLLS